jgi:hypothetical protein
VVVVVPLGAGTPADATEDAAAGAELAGSGETTAVDVASGAADEAPVAKTPGEPAEDDPEAGVEEVADGGLPTPDDVDAAAGEVLTDEGLPGATAAALPQVGGVTRLTPIVPIWTELPGSGYNVSWPSTVLQPLSTLAMLAKNIAGKLVWRLETFGSGA